MARLSEWPRGLVLLGQVAVAAVWLYEGLIAKILGTRGDEAAILAGVPLIPTGLAPALPYVLGGYEVLLAGWVLLGRLPRAAAVVQTLTLIGFNTGGLIFGGDQIPEPVHLLVNNLAFCVLGWFVAIALSRAARIAIDPDDA